MNKKQKKVLTRIIAFWFCCLVDGFSNGTLRSHICTGVAIFPRKSAGVTRNRQVFDENFLMAVATIGAMLSAIIRKALRLCCFTRSENFSVSYAAVERVEAEDQELMDIRPDYANIEQDGKLEKVDPDEVEVGTIIVVQPGEKIPIDGTIEDGNSTLNTSALTGESLPRDAKVGDEVISGCINMTGVLKIRTTKEFGESTVSKILDLVENSSSKKSRSENFISKSETL